MALSNSTQWRNANIQLRHNRSHRHAEFAIGSAAAMAAGGPVSTNVSNDYGRKPMDRSGSGLTAYSVRSVAASASCSCSRRRISALLCTIAKSPGVSVARFAREADGGESKSPRKAAAARSGPRKSNTPESCAAKSWKTESSGCRSWRVFHPLSSAWREGDRASRTSASTGLRRSSPSPASMLC